jgi:hypothetical protein
VPENYKEYMIEKEKYIPYSYEVELAAQFNDERMWLERCRNDSHAQCGVNSNAGSDDVLGGSNTNGICHAQ